MPDVDDIPYVNLIHYATSDAARDNVPIFGDVWRSINAVVDFVEFGCFPNWTVWVETLLPALGEVVIELLSFGVDDVIRGYFRPNGTRGFSGFTRLPRRAKNRAAGEVKEGSKLFEIPEFGEEIGKHLPGAQTVKARKVTNTERLLWEVDGVVQRGLWYWMIADITSDFIVNWTTAIMQSEACSEQAEGMLQVHESGVRPYFTEAWYDHTGWVTDVADPPGIWDGISIHVPAGKTLSYTLSGTAGPWLFAPPIGGELGMKRGGLGTHLLQYSGWPIGPAWDNFEISLTGRITGETVITPVGYLHGGVEGSWANMKLTASY